MVAPIGRQNAESSWRPIKASTPEYVEKMHDMVLADRKVKVCEIDDAVGFHMAL